VHKCLTFLPTPLIDNWDTLYSAGAYSQPMPSSDWRIYSINIQVAQMNKLSCFRPRRFVTPSCHNSVPLRLLYGNCLISNAHIAYLMNCIIFIGTRCDLLVCQSKLHSCGRLFPSTPARANDIYLVTTFFEYSLSLSLYDASKNILLDLRHGKPVFACVFSR